MLQIAWVVSFRTTGSSPVGIIRVCNMSDSAPLQTDQTIFYWGWESHKDLALFFVKNRILLFVFKINLKENLRSLHWEEQSLKVLILFSSEDENHSNSPQITCCDEATFNLYHLAKVTAITITVTLNLRLSMPMQSVLLQNGLTCLLWFIVLPKANSSWSVGKGLAYWTYCLLICLLAEMPTLTSLVILCPMMIDVKHQHGAINPFQGSWKYCTYTPQPCWETSNLSLQRETYIGYTHISLPWLLTHALWNGWQALSI